MAIEKESIVSNYLNKFLVSTPVYSDLSGGINVRKNQIELQTNEFFSGKNIYLNNNMGIVGRDGIRKIVATEPPFSGEINGLYHARFSNGNILIVCIGYTVFAWDGSSWINLTSSVGTRTSVPLDIYTFTFYNDNLIIADGANYPLKVSYDGTNFTVTEMTNAPKCNYVFSWYSFIMFAGDGTNKVYFSAPNDIDTYPLENYLLVGGNRDNQPITAITSILGNIIVFKRNSTYSITGNTTDNLVVTQINPNIGCIAENCVCNTRTDVYFLSSNGVWRITSGLSFEYLSEKILPRFQSLPKTYTNYNRPVIVYNPYKEQVWLSVDYNNDDYHDRVFVFDLIINNSITEYYFYEDLTSNFNPRVITQYYDERGNIRLISANRKDKYIRIHDSNFTEGVYGDDGNIVYAEYESKLFNLGDPNKLKSLKYYYLYGNIFGSGSVANNNIITYNTSSNISSISSITLSLSVRGSTSHIYNNYLYVIGGYDGSVKQIIQVINLLDGSKRTIQIPSSIGGVAYHSSVIYNDDIYVFGGWNGANVSNKIFRFNISSETFTLLTNHLITAREWHTSNIIGNKVYIIGGYNSTFLSSIEEFDISTGNVIAKTNLNYPVCLHSSAVYGNNIYIFGGYPSTNNSQYVRYYNSISNTIVELGDIMPIPVYEHSSIEFNVSGTDYAYIFGGYYAGTTYNTVYRYNFSTNSFSLVGNIPYYNYWFSICKDSNYIYNIGGQAIASNTITFKYTNDMVNFTSISTQLSVGSRQIVPTLVGSIPYKFISVKITSPINWSNFVINGYMLDYIIWQRRN